MVLNSFLITAGVRPGDYGYAIALAATWIIAGLLFPEVAWWVWAGYILFFCYAHFEPRMHIRMCLLGGYWIMTLVWSCTPAPLLTLLFHTGWQWLLEEWE